MKRIILIVLVVILGGFTSQSFAQKKGKSVVCFKSDMDCANCQKTLNEYLKFEKGVKDLKVDHASNTILIEYKEGKNTDDGFAKAIEKKGYKAEKITVEKYKEIMAHTIEHGPDPAVLYLKENDKWIKTRDCTSTVQDNRVKEKMVSRYAFPQRLDSWRYEYKYSFDKLLGWKKLIKNENNIWEENRKVEYIYKNEILSETRDYQNYDHTQTKLDYLRLYFAEKGRILSWEAGVCADNHECQATQKTEYDYEYENLSHKTFSICDVSLKSWKNFGEVNYQYDRNNYLIEEIASDGTKTNYEYEKGTGNASLIYCFRLNLI